MFEVRIFCEDKKLSELLWALDGKIVGMPQLLPVRDAKPSKDGSKVVGTAPQAHKIDLIRDLIRMKGVGGKLTYQEIVNVMTGAGANCPRGVASHYLNALTKDKVLARVERGVYIIKGE